MDSTSTATTARLTVGERLRDAVNAHDLDAFVACFHEDYRSEQPAHPARGFGGREQVRKNWGAFFDSVPDLRADLRANTVDGDREWTEWRFHGTRRDGTRFDLAGVIVMGLGRDGRIASGRVYIEEVEQAGAGIDESVRRTAEGRTGGGRSGG